MSEASHSTSEESRPGGPGVGQHGGTGQPVPGVRHRNEAVLGPFTVRDLTLLGGVLITFVGSLLPLLQRNALLNLWNAQNIFFLAIGFLLPAAAAGLFIWRRLEPRRSLRVGSLSVDQFASVVAVLSCSYYFVFTVTTFTPGAVVGLLGGIALVGATTAARVIPPFAGDFDGRAATPAHIVARDAVQPVHRPAGADAHGPAHGPEPVGTSAGPVREGLAGDSAAEDERSAAWFGAGWAASAAGAGAAAGAGVAGAGVREPGAPQGGVAAETRRASEPSSAGGASEMLSAFGAAPAGSAHTRQAAEGSPVPAPSADDVARPDTAHETAARGAADVPSPSAGPGKQPEPVPGAEARGAGGAERAPGVDTRPAAAESAGRETERAGTAAGIGAAAGAGTAAGAGAAAGASAGARAGAGDTGPETAAMPAGSPQAEVERENGRQLLDQLAEEPVPTTGAASRDEEQGAAREAGTVETAHSEPRAAEQAAGAAQVGERGPEPWLEGGYGDADGEAYGAPEAPAPATAVFPSAGSAGGGAGTAGVTQSIGASRPFDEQAQQYEAFWFAVSQPRTAVDAMTGEPLFILEPGQWILALQDRGHEFVVQNTDGRVGVLRELSGIERG